MLLSAMIGGEERSGLVGAAVIISLFAAGVGLVLGWLVRSRLARHRRQIHEEQLAEIRLQTGTLRQDHLHCTQELDTCRTRIGAVEEQAAYLRAQAEELPRLRTVIDELQQTIMALERDRARLVAELQAEREKAEHGMELLREAKGKFTDEFRNLAQQILDAKTKSLAESGKTQLESILDPFRIQLKDLSKRIEDNYINEGKERHSLGRQVAELQKLNIRLSEDAENLARALVGQAKTRGTWGEIILERVLEASGLTAGREYEVQGSRRSADGRLQRPDVIVHLPEEKDIVIDSKVSLVAYERYVRTAENGPGDTDTGHERVLADHLASMKQHIRDLAGKRYDELPGIRSLDFVLMFVPVEGAFLLAIDRDPDIFRQAFEQHVMIVSPSTLLITLRTIHNIWRTEHQNRNAVEIARQAGNLHDQFVRFVDDLTRIGDFLDRGRDAWEQAYRRLAGGRGNLVRRTENLKLLGVKARKQLPEEVLRLADMDDADLNDVGLDDTRTDDPGVNPAPEQ
ncbi:MAG: DNA recombination protein RmuC [Deltaproteobacteria bacterium]|nr:DNA recombination protein RmuC [Candidatus Anaeroferrophillacea bacterium]